MRIFFEGFLLTLGFIMSIGPQNTFLLKQGASRQQVFLTALVSGIFNGALLTAGIFGAGRLLTSTYPLLKTWLLWSGVVFLFGFSLHSFFLAYRGRPALNISKAKPQPLKKLIGKALFLSWINPLNILENIILIGTLSTCHAGMNLYVFAGGALLAPFSVFFGLSYGASYFSKHMASPRIWRFIDAFVGTVCLSAGIRVLIQALREGSCFS